MYLAYSALQSEPRDYECNALGARMSAAGATTLATGVVLTLVCTVYSAFRAGSNTQTFRWGGRGRGLGTVVKLAALGCAGGWQMEAVEWHTRCTAWTTVAAGSLAIHSSCLPTPTTCLPALQHQRL